MNDDGFPSRPADNTKWTAKWTLGSHGRSPRVHGRRSSGRGLQSEDAVHGILFFFLDGKSRCHVQSARSTQVSGGTCEMLRWRSAGLPLTLNIPPTPLLPPKKNKEKASNEVSTIAPGQNTLHVGAAVSYCVIRFIGRPDKPRFNTLSSNAVKIKS